MEIGQRIANGFEKQAFVRVTGDECGACIAAALPTVAGVEAESAFLFFCAVAFDAAVLKEWTDVVLEEVVGVRC